MYAIRSYYELHSPAESLAAARQVVEAEAREAFLRSAEAGAGIGEHEVGPFRGRGVIAVILDVSFDPQPQIGAEEMLHSQYGLVHPHMPQPCVGGIRQEPDSYNFV